MLSPSFLEPAIYVYILLSTAIPIALAAPPTTDPPWQLDAIPPYPSLTNITTANTLRTRLFGWVGCSVQESQMIAEAYDDFYKLAQQDGVYQNIAWDGEAAIEFFGPSKGLFAVSDARRTQIQRKLDAELNVSLRIYRSAKEIYQAAQQVRCSGGDGSGDKDNICGDAPGPGGCFDGQRSTPGTSNRLQAYSAPNTNTNDYSQITLCNGFFDLKNLADAIRLGLARNPASAGNDLDTYDNRARYFFHEVVHLDYFMNTPSQGPVIDDVRITTKTGKLIETDFAYGAKWAKVLANYRAQRKGGFYSQRNAKTLDFFALAKYVTTELGRYPYNPQTKQRPISPPQNQFDESYNTATDPIPTAADIPDDQSVGLVSNISGVTTGLADYMGNSPDKSTYNQTPSYYNQIQNLPGCPDVVIKPHR